MFAPTWTVRQLLASDHKAVLAFSLESIGLVAGLTAVWVAGVIVSLWLVLSELSVDVQMWDCDGRAGGCGIVIYIVLGFFLVVLAVLWAILAYGLMGIWLIGRCLRVPWPVLAVIVGVGLAGLSMLINYSTARIAQDALRGALFVAGTQIFWGAGSALVAPSLARKLSR